MIPYFKVFYSDEETPRRDISKYVLTIQINKGAEANKNTVNIEFTNPNGELNNPGQGENTEWRIDKSEILLYIDWKPINVSLDVPMISAIVSSISYPVENNGKYKLKITATDKTGLLLNKLWAGSYPEVENWAVSRVGAEILPNGTANSVKSIIHNLVGHVNGLEGVTPYNLTARNVATKKVNGDAFPERRSIAKIWKPIWEWLNELSGTDYTGENRPYVFFIDSENDLHWHYPYQKDTVFLTSAINSTQTTIPVNSTETYPERGVISIGDELIYYNSKSSNQFLECTRGYALSAATSHVINSPVGGNSLRLGKEDIYKLNIETTDETTYNFIIYNAGKTPRGYEYLEYALDESQIGKKFKMIFKDFKSISDALYLQERSSSGWGADRNTEYPNSYPYTMTFRTTGGNEIIVNDDTQFHIEFQSELKRRGDSKCAQLFRQGEQRYKADAQMRGNKNYKINEIVNVYSPKFEKSILLRVKEIKHQLNRGSWITDIELAEDPEILPQ